jgi:hypothetical protein
VRLIVSALAVAAIPFVVAGCGGGASAEEKWAETVCTDVSDWKNRLQQATDDISAELQSPGAGTLAAIEADVRKAVDATSELADELKALDAPKTESGAQAKQRLDALASQLEGTVNKARQTLETLPEGADVAATVEKLAPLAPALQSLALSTSSTLEAVKAQGADLKEGFDKADSCEELR